MSLQNFFSGGGSTQRSTSYTPVQAEWQKNLFGLYGPTAGQGQQVYGGEWVAPQTAGQQEAANLGGWSQYLQPAGNMPMYSETGDTLRGMLAGETGASPITQEQVNQLFSSAYEQPAMRSWEQFVKPQIRESYSGPGFWGSARMKAEEEGAQDLRNWLGEQYGQMTWSADQANRALEEAKAGRALAAIGPGLAYGQVPLQQTLSALAGRGAMYDLAGTQQQQQQAEINAAMEQYIQENRLTDPENLQVLMDLLGMAYSSSKGASYAPQLGYVWSSGLGQTPSTPK